MADSQALGETLRQMFKNLNRWLMVPMWRLGWGAMINWTWRINGRIMVLVSTGRKSGLRRYTPLNYLPEDGAVCATAGFGMRADWLYNVLESRTAELWLPQGRFSASVEEFTGQPGALGTMRAILMASGFAAPLFMGVDPARISDEDLARETADYRLLRFRLGERITGPDGPGSWAWVWIPLGLITAALLAWALLR